MDLFSDWNAINERLALQDFHLNGKMLVMEKLEPPIAIQVQVSAKHETILPADYLTRHFAVSKPTAGSSDMDKIDIRKVEQRPDVFVITYSSHHGKILCTLFYFITHS